MTSAGRQRCTCFAECFEELAGVPAVLLADRMDCLKTGVVANVVVPRAEYVPFAAHYGFRPDFCEAADPESKGLAGFKPEEVEITFTDGVLKIQAQHSQESSQEQAGYLRREVAYGNYQRSLQLPGDLKEDEISADFENGVLTVTVPRVPRPQPKKIQVAAGGQKQLSGVTS